MLITCIMCAALGAPAVPFLDRARARARRRTIRVSLSSERNRIDAVLAFVEQGIAADEDERALSAELPLLAIRERAVAARWTRNGRHADATQLIKMSCEVDPFSLSCWSALCASAVRSADYRLAIIACGDAAALDDPGATRRRFDGSSAAALCIGAEECTRSSPLADALAGRSAAVRNIAAGELVARRPSDLADALLRSVNATRFASSWNPAQQRSAREFAHFVYSRVDASGACSGDARGAAPCQVSFYKCTVTLNFCANPSHNLTPSP